MTGMPVAPLALNDEVSLELAYHVREQTKKDLGDKYKAGPADTLLEEMVMKRGRKGKKNGKGFYDYPEDGQKRLWPGLSEIIQKSDEQPDVDELKKRFLYIQALETARCFEEKRSDRCAGCRCGRDHGLGLCALYRWPSVLHRHRRRQRIR